MTISDATLAVGLWTGLYLALVLFLTLRIVRIRMKHRIGTGHGENTTLERAVRAHGNATEHVPALLFGLLLLSLLGFDTVWIHALGATLLLARMLHAYGMHVIDKPVPLTRSTGNVLTWIITLVILVLLISKFAMAT